MTALDERRAPVRAADAGPGHGALGDLACHVTVEPTTHRVAVPSTSRAHRLAVDVTTDLTPIASSSSTRQPSS